MKILKSSLLILSILLSIGLGTAQATVVPWKANFNNVKIYGNHIQIYVESPGSWSNPSIDSFSDVSWKGSATYGAYSIADGSNVDRMNLSLHFNSYPCDSFNFHFQSWYDQVIKTNVDYLYNGAGRFISSPGTWNSLYIPEPATVFILGVGSIIFIQWRPRK